MQSKENNILKRNHEILCAKFSQYFEVLHLYVNCFLVLYIFFKHKVF